MLHVDISFIFHLFFISVGCYYLQVIFFDFLYDIVFVEKKIVTGLQNTLSRECSIFEEATIVHKKEKKDISLEFRSLIRGVNKERLDHLKLSNKGRKSCLDQLTEQELLKESRLYAYSVLLKLKK